MSDSDYSHCAPVEVVVTQATTVHCLQEKSNMLALCIWPFY